MHCDMDYIPGAESETGSESVITRIGVPLAGPVNVPGQDVYRYSADYSDPTFPPKVTQETNSLMCANRNGSFFLRFKDGQNNNGYVPYVDYSRDYNPPVMQPPISSSLDPTRESLQSTRLQLNSLQAHQLPVSAANLPLNDLSEIHMATTQNIPNGGLAAIDPRFSATYGNPYLRNPNVGLPTPNTANPAATPAPPPYSRDGSRNSSAMLTASANVVNTVVSNGSNGTIPQVTRLPNSPTSQYIVPNLNLNAIKRGTMATHV